MLLAALQAVTFDSHLGVRCGLAILGTVGCGLVFVLGRQLADAEVGLWGAAGAAVSPAAVGFAPLFLSETAFGTALVGSMVTAVALVRGVSAASRVGMVRTLAWGFAAGLAVGVATHLRPTWLIVGPAVALAALVFGRLSARSFAGRRGSSRGSRC